MNASESLEKRLGELYDSCSSEERDVLGAMFVLASAYASADDDASVEGFAAAAFDGGGGVGKVSITPIPIPEGFEPGGGLGDALAQRLTAAQLSTRLVSLIR